jgi:adenosyl cobinamide kinase/adenosyl cobinamide phosphate guanylyltransferase
MSRIKLRVEAGNASTKKLEEAIAKAQQELAEQIRLVGEECQEGISRYQELDRLYPDHLDGQAV